MSCYDYVTFAIYMDYYGLMSTIHPRFYFLIAFCDLCYRVKYHPMVSKTHSIFNVLILSGTRAIHKNYACLAS